MCIRDRICSAPERTPLPAAEQVQVSRVRRSAAWMLLAAAVLLALCLKGGGERLFGGDLLSGALPLSGKLLYLGAAVLLLSLIHIFQWESGGFASWGMENAESVSQVIIALGTLGIPLDDPRFAKGEGLLGNLLGYYREGAGFVHVDGLAGDDQMTTEQAFCALVAAERQSLGKCALYRMEDALFVPDGGAPGEGLPGKHPDVTRNPVREPGKSFADIADHPDREAIEALAARGVIGGRRCV